MSADFDAEIAQRIKSKGKPEGCVRGQDYPNRIEEINDQIARLERQYLELDTLTAAFKEGDDHQRRLLTVRAGSAMERLADRMQSLVDVLALEKPKTNREVLIFVLRALNCMQTAVDGVPKEDSHEWKMGAAAYLFLRGMIPALEDLSGATRSELGFEADYYFFNEDADELIEGLKVPLAKTEAAS